ncbi:MAG: ribosomal silencing factor RsfS [Chitinophagaceae bacterium]|nr:ribosome silencing factor [Chitinophagales bacterium]
MTTSSTLPSQKKAHLTRLTRNSKIFKTIVRAIEDKKGESIVSLDLRKIPEAVADFFIICQATSTTQLKAISDFVEEQVNLSCGENPYKQEGRQAMQWILVDYVNIVVHIMHPDTRNFYKLEEIWNDAGIQKHEL